MFAFTVVETFDGVVNRRENRYLAGHTYTVRDGPEHDELREKVLAWADDGKVVLGGAPSVTVTGRISA